MGTNRDRCGLIVTLAVAAGMFVQTAGAAEDSLWSELPPPVLLEQAHLVVEGTLVERGPVEEQRLRLPRLDVSGWPRPIAEQPMETVRLRTCELEVTRFLRSIVPNAHTKERFTVLMHDPRDGASDRPAEWTTPRLRKGKTYLFLLRYMDDGKTFYLPRHRHGAMPVDQAPDVFGRAWNETLDPAAWPWGATNAVGMQMCTFVRQPVVAADEGTTPLPLVIALRNDSPHALSLSLFAGLRPLALTLQGPGSGEDASAQLLNIYRTTQPDPRSVPFVAVPPGRICFLSEAGSAAWWSVADVRLEPGRYTLKASYTMPMPENKNLQRLFWTGTLSAPPLSFDVVADADAAP